MNRPADYVVPGVPESIAIICMEVGKRLTGASCEVLQYCGRFRGQPKRSQIDGMEFRRLPFVQDKPLVAMGKLCDRFRDPRRPHYASKLFFYPTNARLLARDLRGSGCDVAHIHLYPQTVHVVRKSNPRLKIVLHMHCEWLNQLEPAMVRPGIEDADAIVGVSEFISERIRRAFPSQADRVRTVYNAVDTARFAAAAHDSSNGRPRRILYTARISPEKGTHVLARAFNRVHEKAPDVELRICGGEHLQPLSYYKAISDDPNLNGLEQYYSGSYMEQVKKLLTPSALQRVTFVGELDYTQMNDEYARGDVFVHPSVWNDPSPLVIGEAMSAGLPVVATRVGGQPELVGDDGVAGLLVPPNDPQALADALLALLTDDSKRHRMAAAARQRAVNKFDWNRMAGELLELYRGLCDNR
ncbi:MAG TPA: glycosyltransferase family 4 protein [Tepidisphaeraceae bacterium]